MGRFLSVSEYGLLISLIALLGLLTLFQASLTTLFAKFAAQYAVHHDFGSEKSFIRFASKFILLLSGIFFLCLIVLSSPISKFLHFNNFPLLLLIFLTVFFSILYSLPSGILQGNLKFKFLALINIFGGIGKVVIGIILVLLGFGVVGGAIGVLMLFVLPLLCASLYVYFSLRSKKAHKKTVHVQFLSEFAKISGPFLAASMAITFLQGSDVIFAKHFFNNVLAGQYAALSVMGKAIFYVTSPIYFAFFPIIAHKKEKKEKTTGTLVLASVIILACSGMFSLLYFLEPSLVLKIFFPAPAYAMLKSYLGFYSLYILTFSVCFLLTNYFLSIGKTGIYKINTVIILLYVVLLFLFHKNITDLILVLVFTSFLLLCSLLVYYWRNETD